jgi:hypothetical protein
MRMKLMEKPKDQEWKNGRDLARRRNVGSAGWIKKKRGGVCVKIEKTLNLLKQG